MQKKVLIIHGYPQEVDKDHPVYIYFKSKKYKIFAPRLFSSELDLDLGNAKKIIKKELGKNIPDVVLGFSLGGLILPHVAADYPDAELIFVSTGTKYNPRYKYHRTGLYLASMPVVQIFLFLLRTVPDSILFFFYSKINPCGKEDDREWYRQDKLSNFETMRKIPAKKHRQAICLILSLDNTELLRTIKNKCIILSGEGDILMPVSESKKLHELLKGSRLITVKKSHFAVIDRESLAKLDKYL